MGLKPFGFAGGRADVWEPEEDIYWGSDGKWLGDKRSGERELENPLAAVQMGLLYVNPEGPNGKLDPLASAKDIRETFARMAWTPIPIKWDNGYFDTLFGWEWEVTKSPAGAWIWEPTDREQAKVVPDAHVPGKKVLPVMSTADMAMCMDPIYEKISRRFHQNPDQLADAFARAWFKLTHRDTGPRSRYLGALVPSEELIWQNPTPAVNHELIYAKDIAALKTKILGAGLPVSQLVATAWASASIFRGSDKRGGANGARARDLRDDPGGVQRRAGRLEGKVRARLRGRVEQGDAPGSVRPGLIPASSC